MSFLIAAAGTGGHVFPGLAVGEALVRRGVPRSEVLYVGGSRLEASTYPEAGFPFLQLELRGLQRSLTLANLTLPRVVMKARDAIGEAMSRRAIGVALGMGGYVTVPTALAARKRGVVLMIAEQNADAGLANRLVKRWATRRFSSFPVTRGLRNAEWVGNPVRTGIQEFDRGGLRAVALRRYSLDPSVPVVGFVGGSLGAGVINAAAAAMAKGWSGPPAQILHITGERDFEGMGAESSTSAVWQRIAFEPEMEYFYAASDLVVTRAGGAVAELTATATPAILVPGGFGSAGHQQANAGFLEKAGAGVVLLEDRIQALPSTVGEILATPGRLERMAAASAKIARPDAADVIAGAMMEVSN